MATQKFETETVRGVVAFPFLLPDGSGDRAKPGDVIEADTAWMQRKAADGHISFDLPPDVQQIQAKTAK